MSSATRRFVLHYAEMVAVMLLGMVVLGTPAAAGLEALGVSHAELEHDLPALMLLFMGASMTVPMVAWMRFRGHSARANAEMAASMVLPTLLAVGLLAAGIVTDTGALMGLQHLLMFPGMLVAMLLRRDEYTRHAHRGTAEVVA